VENDAQVSRRFSEFESSVRAGSWADFITNMLEVWFSVHTQ